MTAAAGILIGYLLGSIPTGLIAGRFFGRVDIREFGSGKTGVTNALRTLGRGAALLVLGVDVAKGALPVLIGRFVFEEPWAAALGGGAAVVGHTWPVFARFRGGRGVSTTFGAFLAAAPIVAVIMLALAGLILFVTRYVSAMSVVGVFAGFIALIVLVVAGSLPAQYLAFGALATLFVELNHLGNIRRLLAGTEPKIGESGTPRAPGRT